MKEKKFWQKIIPANSALGKYMTEKNKEEAERRLEKEQDKEE